MKSRILCQESAASSEDHTIHVGFCRWHSCSTGSLSEPGGSPCDTRPQSQLVPGVDPLQSSGDPCRHGQQQNSGLSFAPFFSGGLDGSGSSVTWQTAQSATASTPASAIILKVPQGFCMLNTAVVPPKHLCWTHLQLVTLDSLVQIHSWWLLRALQAPKNILKTFHADLPEIFCRSQISHRSSTDLQLTKTRSWTRFQRSGVSFFVCVSPLGSLELRYRVKTQEAPETTEVWQLSYCSSTSEVTCMHMQCSKIDSKMFQVGCKGVSAAVQLSPNFHKSRRICHCLPSYLFDTSSQIREVKNQLSKTKSIWCSF